jgi:hypothetical protein
MTALRLLLLLSFSLLLINSSSAQDDSWWKKLFKKETAEEAQSSPADSTKESEGTISPNEGVNTLPAETTDTVATVFIPTTEGRITVSKPAGIDKLDSLYRAEPPTLRGYRIQIYFGDLNSAREKRLQFISANDNLPCYMVQNAPNFAVLVGDFRTHLDAYREVQMIKASYPLATIVPAKIEPPTID